MLDKLVPKNLIRAADLSSASEESFTHPLNPRSEVRGHSLSDPTGLERLGVHLIRIAPGRESFAYHRHYGEEEFIYVVSGRGIAEIDDQDYEVGPGDFMGFPTPSVGHHMRNPFSEELVYLSGGERHPLEVAEFPRHGILQVRSGQQISMVPTSAAEAFVGFEKVGGTR